MAEYASSELSRVEFCRKQGLSVATLARYRKRQQTAQEQAQISGRWLKVEVAGPEAATASGLVVALPGGRRIEVGRGFDPGTLRRLMEILERC